MLDRLNPARPYLYLLVSCWTTDSRTRNYFLEDGTNTTCFNPNPRNNCRCRRYNEWPGEEGRTWLSILRTGLCRFLGRQGFGVAIRLSRGQKGAESFGRPRERRGTRSLVILYTTKTASSYSSSFRKINTTKSPSRRDPPQRPRINFLHARPCPTHFVRVAVDTLCE